MRSVIVDNEPNIIAGLQRLLQQYCPGIEVIGTAEDLNSGKRIIERERPDLLFLDIELGHHTGMDLLKQLHYKDFQLIFITAYDKYAVEAFKFSAIDYLLKPIDPDDLTDAVNRCREQFFRNNDLVRLNVLVENLQHLSTKPQKIVITDRENVFALDLENILYLQADGAYTRLFTNMQEGSIFASKNLKHFETLLQDAGFYRVHHSYLANLLHMKRFDKLESILEFTNDKQIPVSSRRKDGLMQLIKNKLFLN